MLGGGGTGDWAQRMGWPERPENWAEMDAAARRTWFQENRPEGWNWFRGYGQGGMGDGTGAGGGGGGYPLNAGFTTPAGGTWSAGSPNYPAGGRRTGEVARNWTYTWPGNVGVSNYSYSGHANYTPGPLGGYIPEQNIVTPESHAQTMALYNAGKLDMQGMYARGYVAAPGGGYIPAHIPGETFANPAPATGGQVVPEGYMWDSTKQTIVPIAEAYPLGQAKPPYTSTNPYTSIPASYLIK
jgi:hypothetical protein